MIFHSYVSLPEGKWDDYRIYLGYMMGYKWDINGMIIGYRVVFGTIMDWDY